VVRAVAGHDPLRYEAVLDLPLREALIAYEARLREVARDDYRLALLQYTLMAAAGAKLNPPEIPAILRG
jgi:hypothetical protein